MVSLQFWFPFYTLRDGVAHAGRHPQLRARAALGLEWWDGEKTKQWLHPTHAKQSLAIPGQLGEIRESLCRLGRRGAKLQASYSPRPVPFSGPRSRMEEQKTGRLNHDGIDRTLIEIELSKFIKHVES